MFQMNIFINQHSFVGYKSSFYFFIKTVLKNEADIKTLCHNMIFIPNKTMLLITPSAYLLLKSISGEIILRSFRIYLLGYSMFLCCLCLKVKCEKQKSCNKLLNHLLKEYCIILASLFKVH